MRMSRFTLFLLCFSLCASYGAESRADFIFDARTDFIPGSPVSGVNGVWSYGYLGGSNGFTLFEEYTTNPNGYGWRRLPHENGAPGLYRFTASGVLPGINAGDLVLHPGSHLDDDYSVLRFTTPTAGLYNLLADWKAGDSGSVDVRIFRGGVELYSDPGDSDGGSYSSSSLLLAASETIELRVGRYDGFQNDNTPINLTITGVPEPAMPSILGYGLGCLLLRRRQRR